MNIDTKQHLTAETSYQYATKDDLKVSQATERDQPKNVEINAKKDESDVPQIKENDQSKNVEPKHWSRRKDIQGEEDQDQLYTYGINQDGNELDSTTSTGTITDINNKRMQFCNNSFFY